MEQLTIPDWLRPVVAATLVPGGQMPHALLIHGPTGVGKRVLGRILARGLLCEADAPHRVVGGCGRCPACLWFDQGSHPDFRRLTSEAIAAAEGAADDEGDGDGTSDETAGPRSKKTPSRDIRVEQVRALQRFLSVATHRGVARVVLLYPLEALNDVGANALLKMLEEPPPRTVFILVADHLGHVAPTIVSRCRKIPVALPARADALAWLATQGLTDDADRVLALCGGAPFAALELAGDPSSLEAHRELVAFLAAPTPVAALAAAEAWARRPPAPLLGWLQLWLADCIAMRMATAIRYHPSHSEAIARLVAGVSPERLFGLERRLVAVRRTVDHPLNGRLLFEALLLAYAEVLDAQPASHAPIESSSPR